MNRLAIIIILLISSLISYSQCDSSSLDIRLVRASDTDPNISFELEKHRVFYNPTCTSQNTLVVNMVGTFGVLSNFNLFPSIAANNGFHVISIKYDNSSSEAIECASSGNLNCYENYHIENLYGYDSLASISIDTNNCLLNRIKKLISYLDANYPGENWGQFLSGNNVDWTNTIVAGHSQGGSHAAYIAHEFNVKRALFFASPFEYYNNQMVTAPWVSSLSQTPNSKLFSFSNLYDEISPFAKQYQCWTALGMQNNGDTMRIDNATCPYNNRTMLYTTDSSTIGTSASALHASVYTDAYTFYDGSGNPVFEPVWKYMLGLTCTTLAISEKKEKENNITIFPNPSNGILNIESNYPFNSIQIINSIGQPINSFEYETAQKSARVISLKPGFYLILVKGDTIEKMIKTMVID